MRHVDCSLMVSLAMHCSGIPLTQITNSSYTAFSLPLPEHNFKVPAFRISAAYVPGRHRCLGKERLVGGYQLSFDHGDHTIVPTHHGNWLGT